MFDYLMGSTSLLEAVEGYDNGMTAEEDAFMESIDAIPCMDDPEDAFDRIAMETVENFYAITNAITVDEFAHYVATNEEVIYEEGKIKQVFGTIKDWILKAWAKVKGVFEAAIDRIGSFVRNDKKFLEKYKSDIEKAGSVELEKGYNVNWDVVSSTEYLTRLVQTFKNTTGIKDTRNGLNMGSKGYIDKNTNNDNFKVDEIVSQFRGYALEGKGTLTEEEFNKKLKDMIIPDKTTKVTLNAATVIAEIGGAKEARANIKKAYDDAKRFFNDMIKEAKSVEKVAIAAQGKKDAKDSGIMSAVGKFNSMCKSCISIATKIKKVQIKGVNRLYHQARHAGVLMARKNKNDSKNESASMLESLVLI